MSEELSRAEVLLQAAFDILKQQHDSCAILNCLELTVNYDDAVCDGTCLMIDIACELGIDTAILI